MSSSFIGSKIAIVTKSQSRYSGTIIGIDAQASSIILGNVKCYGTENRLGNLSNGSSATDSIVPIMQFANSDIEDLKIVDEESTAGDNSTKAVSNNSVTTGSAPVKQTSIHDDPAIVSAVVSSSNKETSSVPNRLIRDLNHLNLFDEPKKVLSKTDESHRRTDSGDLGATWSLLSPSKWTGSNSVSQAQPVSSNKSKFFDNFTLNSTESIQPQRSQRWMPSSLNNHGTQTSNRSNQYDDERDLPTRQPFFSEDQPFSPQQNFSINGSSHQHRNFTNNRRPPMRRRPMGGGNRETFYDNGMHYDDEFDFESSNRKFNKITNEEEFKQPADSLQTFKLAIESHQDGSIEYQPVYDKKKSFFDNISLQETTDLPVPMYHRSRNQDTFGNNHHNDRYQRSKYRGNGNGNGYGGQRRTNYQNNSNSNQNGYHYRY